MHHHLRALSLAVLLATTAAHAPVAAQIDVYFTQPVDTTLASTAGNRARYHDDVAALVAQLIDRARGSVDIAMYSLNSASVVDALVDAHERGVRVRCIANAGSAGSASSRFDDLAAAGIPIASSPTAANGDPQPLMHNKFIVIDARTASGGATPTVITGSWNATYLQTIADANNVVVVRDSAVARAYRREFEEMWGSSTDTPNLTSARFGRDKRDNTEHSFTLVDGTRLEVFFSPSDDVESHISAAIASSRSSLYTASLTITSTGLSRDLVRQRSEHGVDVRSLIENVDDSASRFEFLSGAIEALSTATVPGLLHHKYAIVDAVASGGEPVVITGSHNWTYAAESVNDENTIIIHSATIANQFLQEFAARYREAGGTRPFGVADVSNRSGRRGTAPSFLGATLVLDAARCRREITIFDALGRLVARGELETGETHQVIEPSLDAGVIVVRVRGCDGIVEAHLLMHPG